METSTTDPILNKNFKYLFKFYFIIIIIVGFTSENEFKCTHPIYCQGNLLKTIQLSRIFSDSKTFVDMPLLEKPDVILKAFEEIPEKASNEELKNFISKYFGTRGTEIVAVEPKDWKMEIKLLKEVKDENLKEWVQFLNIKWKTLARSFNNESCGRDCYSSLWVPYPFIVAGGRFREYYYWDSYFIIEGLLLSEMYETSKGMIKNFFYLIDEYGMIPNAGRIYYLNRSQPPLLTLMVYRYYEETNDLDFLKDSIPYLEKEYSFWNKYRLVYLDEGIRTNLNYYNVDNEDPRPESYFEDILTADKYTCEKEKVRVFKNLASAAESGWDFSSRWFKDAFELSSINTENIIPVDLNSILYKVEITLSKIFSITNNHLKQHFYKHKAILRYKSMKKYLWNEEQAIWNDYLIKEKKQNTNLYISNILPSWAGINNLSKEQVDKLLDTLTPLLKYKGGTPTSMLSTGEQWDFPNAWSPLEYLLIKSLENLNYPKAWDFAKIVSKKWIENNYCTWKKTGYMFEKYDVNIVGKPGTGGEYLVQHGFGWTSAVVLYLIQNYGLDLKMIKCL